MIKNYYYGLKAIIVVLLKLLIHKTAIKTAVGGVHSLVKKITKPMRLSLFLSTRMSHNTLPVPPLSSIVNPHLLILTIFLCLIAIPANAAPIIAVANINDSSISIIDGNSNTVVATVPVGANLSWGSVAVNQGGGFIYAATVSGIYAISTATKAVTSIFPILGGREIATLPNGIIVVTSGLPSPASSGVIFFDPASSQVLATLTLESAPNKDARALAVSSDGTKIYIGIQDRTLVRAINSIVVLDGRTYSSIGSVRLGGCYPQSLEANPSNGSLYVSCMGGVFREIDSTMTLLPLLPLFDRFLGSYMTFSPNGTTVYSIKNQNNTNSDGLYSYDTMTKISLINKLQPGFLDLAKSQNGRALYVTNSDNSVYVMDSSTLTQIAKIPVGNLPIAIAVGNVIDQTAPVITLIGANPLTIAQRSAFTDPGSTVTDNVDTGLVAIVTGAVNTAIVGTYVLTYNASDAAGNVAIAVIRTVNVVAPAPVPAPVPAPAPSGGGGGGCVISTQSGFDPVLPLLALIAGAWLMVRRRKMNY